MLSLYWTSAGGKSARKNSKDPWKPQKPGGFSRRSTLAAILKQRSKSREPEEEVAATLLKTSEVSSGGGTKVAPPGVSSRGAVLPVWSLELVICVHLTDDKSVPNLLLGFIINGQHH